MAVRGTMEESYGKLSSYLFMLAKNNLGTITDIQTDEHGHFRHMFMSLGCSIRGFRYCRPVLCVDASFLKHKIGGQVLVAIALDANEQLFPVAFGVVDLENNNSWTYFMQQLRVAIELVPYLVFVSDRHPSIANALSAVFPKAHHAACTYHIKMNIMAKFKTDNFHDEFDMASRAYIVPQFHQHFDKIKTKDPRIAAYLEQIGVERWSRAFFPSFRYNQMTAEKARFYNVNPLNRFEFHVNDGEHDFQVDLQTRTCTCRAFDLSGLPCKHALATARSRKTIPYEYCSSLENDCIV
ncbi:uncharacterized protein LOC124909578 [Impatiens glandulifera]|uniref:uncharacterized protein LOC124909578 n=1 Tax=Impatiens glandulifera TaxID=253017 RepID=UPI001FB09839|nr:uncharacterized protein LOC124909578 [Impatiens glandulifera]